MQAVVDLSLKKLNSEPAFKTFEQIEKASIKSSNGQDIFNGAGGGIRTHEGLRHRVLSLEQASDLPSAH